MAMWIDAQNSPTPFWDSQDASVARHNLLIEAWLLDLVSSAAPALPQSPVGPCGKKRKRRQYRPVLGEMDRNVRKTQSTHAEDTEMDKGKESAGPTSAPAARVPKTPSSSPAKQQIPASRRKGYSKALREGSADQTEKAPEDNGDANTPRPLRKGQRMQAQDGPSQSDHSQGSPARRTIRTRSVRQQSDIDAANENPVWPGTHYVGVLRQAPALPLPRMGSRPSSESIVTTSTSTNSTQGRRRARSPVKSLSDLPYAETPVYAQSLDDIQELPDDGARDLCLGLRQIASGRHVIPRCVRTHVDARIEGLTRLEEDELEDKHVMADTDPEGNQDTLLMELNTICGIVKQTKRALQPGSNFAEPHWNERIHSRILEAALEPQTIAEEDRSVAFLNVTVAKIASGCMPAHVKGVDLEGKMVDYCVVLCDDEVQNAARSAISAHLQSQSSLQSTSSQTVRSINQSEYAPLHLCPISVSIETKKSGGSEEQAQVQLSVWAMAQFRRIHQIFGPDRPGPANITLPLLYVAGEEWRVLFAWEDEHGINLRQYPRSIGDTRTLLGCYKLLAALRLLARWSGDTFRAWILENLCVQ